MTCHMGGFPTIRHNDIPATLLTEVCHNVATEPPLQPLTGETLTACSANTDDNARLDIRARGFWNNYQDAFFDVTPTHPPRCLQKTRASKEERIRTRTNGPRCRAWCLHTTSSLHKWRNGHGGNDILQTTSRLDCQQKKP